TRREPALARRYEARGKPPGGREAPPEARPARRGPAARRPLPHRARGEPRGPVPLLPGPLDGRARARALVPGSERAGEPDRPLALLDEVQATAAGPLPRTALEATALVPPGEECCELAELVGRASLARWARHADAPPDRLTAALAETGPALAGRLAAIDRRAALEERRSRYF